MGYFLQWCDYKKPLFQKEKTQHFASHSCISFWMVIECLAIIVTQMESTYQPHFVNSGEVEAKICTLALFERVIGKTIAQYLQREKFPFVL